MWMFLGLVAVIGAVVSGMIWAAARRDESPDPFRYTETPERQWEILRETYPVVYPEPVEVTQPDEEIGEPETDCGVDERGYEALHALAVLPAEIEGLAFADVDAYEVAVSLWEWERMSVEGFTLRVDDALARFREGLPMRVLVGAEYPVVDEVTITEDLPRWHHDLVHMLRDVAAVVFAEEIAERAAV